MENNNVKRKIDVIGRIYIPKEILCELKIEPKDSIEFYISNNKIIIKKFKN